MLGQVQEQEQERQLYQEAVKEAFLNEQHEDKDKYTEGTKQTYRRIFTNSADTERELGIDLYDFNTEQVRKLLTDLHPMTFASARTNGRIISAYLNWAVATGRRKTGVNPLQDTHTEWYEQFVDNPTSIYITDEQLRAIEGSCANYQDSIIFRLIFEGIQGTACNEITNLKKSDFDPIKRTVTVSRDGESIALPVSKECILGLLEASREQTYWKKNRQVDDLPENVRPWTDLVDNGYVLRTSNTRTERQDEPVDKHTVYRRIDLIRNLFEDGALDFLAVKNVSKSGMIWYGKRLFETYGDFTKELYEEIAKRYDIKGWWRIQEWVNKDVIAEVYGD